MASIVTLKTGQVLICEINEIFSTRMEVDPETGDEKEIKDRVGLQFKDPFLLKLYENPDAEDPAEMSRVKFDRWNPFTLDRIFRVPFDAVTAVSVPDPNLANAWTEKVEYFDSVDIVDEIPTEETDDTATETAE